MTETTTFIIGSDVSCSDGHCGRVTRVVVDPVARTLTHLVVEPKHHEESGRLVPVAAVLSSSGDVLLHCTKSEFENSEVLPLVAPTPPASSTAASS